MGSLSGPAAVKIEKPTEITRLPARLEEKFRWAALRWAAFRFPQRWAALRFTLLG
ncbi:MAG: hypothetical protein H7Z75_13555 [Ferruginibacter sp.]|nr:hypothetical protein [Cytophagales bacterium]